MKSGLTYRGTRITLACLVVFPPAQLQNNSATYRRKFVGAQQMDRKFNFRVQSHVLKLLGDELIGHPRLAVFELVKNAYDADATHVRVALDLDSEVPKIVIEDDGCGMALSVIEHGWLEVGTDSKRKSLKRTELFNRAPLGEKGVGRLAIQKLGNKVRVTTRPEKDVEHEFEIDWKRLIDSSTYLGDGMQVDIAENRPPKAFRASHGTKIEISDLRQKDWTRGEIRDLYRLVTSLSNPFDKVASFNVILEVPGREADITDLPSVSDMLTAAVWRYKFRLDQNGILRWAYEFNPPRFKSLKSRRFAGRARLELLPPDSEELGKRESSEQGIFLDKSLLARIGPISGRIFAFHRRSEILKESGSLKQIKDWLDSQTGVRVYRDDVRVFNYGETGDDWLGLDARRINRPAGKLGTNNVIASIDLSLDKSRGDRKDRDLGLFEKTNREGFDDNKTYRNLRRIVLSIFSKFEVIHAEDRSAIDKALKGDEVVPTVQTAIEQLEAFAKEKRLETEIRPLVRSIQQELDGFRDIMLASGMAGLNLSLVFHEVVHSIDAIRRRLDSGMDPDSLRSELDHLRKLIETFKPLLQRERARKLMVRDLVSRGLAIHEARFVRHKLVVSNWTNDKDVANDSFPITGPLNLLVGAVSNVIDNAIYWARYRAERDESGQPPALLVFSKWDEDKGGTLAVIDNGVGPQLPRDQLAVPFRTTRVDGIGLGLYYCKMVMESLGGKFDLLEAEDLRDEFDFPDAFNGCAAVFTFKNNK